MKKVLIVDDDHEMLSLLRETLKKEFKIEIDQAYSGESSAEFLHLKKFDLVVSDLQMPNGSGLWLHTFMKKRTPKTPLILFTASRIDDLPSQDEVLKATVSKPKLPALVEAIQNLGVLQ